MEKQIEITSMEGFLTDPDYYASIACGNYIVQIECGNGSILRLEKIEEGN